MSGATSIGPPVSLAVFLCIISNLLYIQPTDAFHRVAFIGTSLQVRRSLRIEASSNIPEYSVSEQDPQEAKEPEGPAKDVQSSDAEDLSIDDDATVPSVDEDSLPSSVMEASKRKTQFAALEPGTVVQVQVGDISLARKAWKKRRRSGSPLLVPCSILNVDRQSTLRWNLIYLLEKFGENYANGIQISLQELNKRHRTHLKSSLVRHCEALGYASPKDLVEALFHKQVQETYGVRLVGIGDALEADDDVASNKIYLQASISRFRAQKRANAAAVLEFCESSEDDSSKDTLQHTGIVRNRLKGGATSDSPYELQPLSAALRVNKDDLHGQTVQNGSFHAAVVFDYDTAGDAGAPLLTLSLNPARNHVRDRLKVTSSHNSKYQPPIRNQKYQYADLNVGDGPIEGKVVSFIKGGVLVDCSVGREVEASKTSSETVRVLGELKFVNAVRSQPIAKEDHGDGDSEEFVSITELGSVHIDGEEAGTRLDEQMARARDNLEDQEDEDEEAEDITHLFELTDDGDLAYEDPESGDTALLPTKDNADDVVSKQISIASEKTSFSTTTRLPTQRLQVGDRIPVYVKSASGQSGQLIYTMDSAVKGKKAKEIKKESDVKKKLSRLAKQLGGLHKVQQLHGEEYNGVVQAASNTGDWFYVRPLADEEVNSRGSPLPVGVARTKSSELFAELERGDSVRIQVEGVDQDRGQMAYTILRKLAP